MPAFDSSQFLKNINNLKDFPNILMLVGDEDMLLSDCLKAFQAAFLKRFGSEMLDFNLEVLYGDKDQTSRILDACSTLPLGSGRRLVIVHEAQKISPNGLEQLETYLTSPNITTSAVFLWNGKPTQQLLGRRMFTLAGKSGTLVRCWKLTFDDRRSEWVRSEILGLGKEIAKEAADLLSREGGESLRELRGEIEKLVLYAGAKKKIEVQDVRETMSFRRDQLVWNFLDHLEVGRIKEAGRTMEHCLEQGEAPVFVLSLMARSARKMASQGSAAKKSRAVQLRLFNELKETDLALKSGHDLESGVFERLLEDYAALAS